MARPGRSSGGSLTPRADQQRRGPDREARGRGEPERARREPGGGRREPWSGRRASEGGRGEPERARREPGGGRRAPESGRGEPRSGRREPASARREWGHDRERRTGRHQESGQRHGLWLFAPTARGLEEVLAAELRALDLADVRIRAAGVSFSGELQHAYRACLWSRTAERVLLQLGHFRAETADALYRGARRLDWNAHLTPRTTLACHATGVTPGLRNTRFAALVVKDAIVDTIRERTGERPSVNVSDPAVRIDILLRDGWVTLNLDLAGEALHRRGYRAPGRQSAAPLKETLAAGTLLLAGWPRSAADGYQFLDPLCGSGTLALEAALIAADIAPGLLRRSWGFLRWHGHDAAAWRTELDSALQRREAGLAALAERARHAGRPLIRGMDRDPRAISLARAAALKAGLSGLVSFEVGDLSAAAPAPSAQVTPGLLATNPPYGERLRPDDLDALYETLGRVLRDRFAGWRAAVLVADEARAAQLGESVRTTARLFNGRIPVSLLRIDVRGVPATTAPDRRGNDLDSNVLADPRKQAAAVQSVVSDTAESGSADAVESPGADAAESRGADTVQSRFPDLGDAAAQLANRLHRNQRVLMRPLRRRGVDCYRVYDADLPDFNMAIDVYGDWIHLQEYAAPAHVDPVKAAARLRAAAATAPAALGLPPEHVVIKLRQRQRGPRQYERLDDAQQLLTVHEGEAKFLVNLTDRLDTGLFLHQRGVRELITSLASGRHFLNLFGYTGTATVAAALGGADGSLTVDLSASYLDWARRNLALNGADLRRHRLQQADCLEWLHDAPKSRRRYGLVLLGPPTFSNSARMGGKTLDVQRDHVQLILQAAELLEPGGLLLFVSGARKLEVHSEPLAHLHPRDVSRATLPADFARQATAHTVWRMQRG